MTCLCTSMHELPSSCRRAGRNACYSAAAGDECRGRTTTYVCDQAIRSAPFRRRRKGRRLPYEQLEDHARKSPRPMTKNSTPASSGIIWYHLVSLEPLRQSLSGLPLPRRPECYTPDAPTL